MKTLNQLWEQKYMATLLGVISTWTALYELLDAGASVHDNEVELLMRRMNEKLDRALPAEYLTKKAE